MNGAHSIKAFESLFYMAHLTFDKKLFLKYKNKEVKQITQQKNKKQHKKICFHLALHLLAFQISSTVILVDNHKLPLPLCGYPKVLKSIGQC